MKKLFTILTIILFSQMSQSQKNNGPYKVLWQQVKELENEAVVLEHHNVHKKIMHVIEGEFEFSLDGNT